MCRRNIQNGTFFLLKIIEKYIQHFVQYSPAIQLKQITYKNV